MSETSEKIPFAVEISRMIEVLAAQIYPTPFALLRENVQNAFDAILLRMHRGQKFDARIDVKIEPKQVSVSDNGIGMSRAELRNHFWRAGSSSKNTDDARAAGVVGTFGIGAMANFGIAETLFVETESIETGERTFCNAMRSTLSVTEDCITFEGRASAGCSGTTITAIMQANKALNVAEAVNYISEFVSFLPIDVYVNETKTSGLSIENSVPQLTTKTWSVIGKRVDLGDGFKADVELYGALSGDMRVALSNIESGSSKLKGNIVLRQGIGTLRTFRSGFGLATVNVSSYYQFGGVADFLFLQPTAGREALVTESLQLLQRIMTRIDEFASENIGTRPESNVNPFFVRWVSKRGRIDLCSNLRVRIEPAANLALHEVRDRSKQSPMLVYSGNDPATVKLASEEKPMIMLSHGSPRRDCEIQYLRKFCRIEELSDNPKVLRPKSDFELTSAEKAFAFRMASILSQDYFLEAHIRFGMISHGLPVLVTKLSPVEIFLDPEGATVRIILELYDKEYLAFGHMTKDFVRNMIFPKVSNLVPSATRQGAEAFLKSIHRTRELFEYETTDLESLTSLWKDYLSGKLSFQQATERSDRVAVRSYQVVDPSSAGAVRDVVPDVIANEATTATQMEANYNAMPPIQRLDIKTEKKVLTIVENETPLKGYRCFLAITDRIREEKGDFFLQPHRTSVVWGGQKALFVFEHHSGDFGLYYDLQTQNMISTQSGGGSFETCTIVMKNRVFIPIPPAIQASFLPQQNEKKRFEVRCDILYIEQGNKTTELISH